MRSLGIVLVSLCIVALVIGNVGCGSEGTSPTPTPTPTPTPISYAPGDDASGTPTQSQTPAPTISPTAPQTTTTSVPLTPTSKPMLTPTAINEEVIDFDALTSEWCDPITDRAWMDMVYKYYGKYFQWTGEVVRIWGGDLDPQGQPVYYIKMSHCPMKTYYPGIISIAIRHDKEPQLLQIMTGSTITYRAYLDQWIGAVGLQAHDGEIMSAPPPFPNAPTPISGGKQRFAHLSDGKMSTITVDAGTTVTWFNHDSYYHRFYSEDNLFDSGDIAPGQWYSFTFVTPGNYNLYWLDDYSDSTPWLEWNSGYATTVYVY